MHQRLKQQLQFLIEIDKVKSIFRRTRLFDKSRNENDAEHSWHLAMMALILSEYANEPIDVTRVVKMVLIHDLVEIDAGDMIIYKVKQHEKTEKETAAAERIFGLLPQEQKQEFIELWQEFEERGTPEARFAAAIDRLEPVMQNFYTDAYAWREHGIKAEQVLTVNRRIEEGSQELWDYAKSLIEECISKGLIS